jgi:glucosamine-6-phosphate deaminase
VKWEAFDSSEALSVQAAALMLEAIRESPRIVLGLPTGRTPIGMYEHLVRECTRECAGEYRCFRDVTTFNLDEYVGVPPGHPGSYCTYMKQHLFEHVDLDPTQTHLPNGMAADLAAECLRYEREIRDAGGLELTFLGLGRNGHIGFNEPGTPFDAHTRVVQLTESTRKANAEFFPEAAVPTHAITMGISTILEAKRIVLLVAGSGKEAALERLRSGIVGEDFPASALWTHPDVTVLAAV